VISAFSNNYEASELGQSMFSARGGAVGIMKIQPASHRVIPAQKSVKTEFILPYDDVKAILFNSQSFGLHDCVCRT
jgi:sporulation protein YlmC with PRC-barrel domain